MASETLARRYAEAIYQLSTENASIERVGADLRTAWELIESDDATRRFFLAPIIDRLEKQTLLIDAFAGKIEDIALHALLLLVGKRRERLLPEILDQYDSLHRAARGAEPLVIASPHAISQHELDHLVSRLSEMYGKQFEVEQRIDPALLGGVRIKMGDVAIDGTVAGKLEELSRTLYSGENK